MLELAIAFAAGVFCGVAGLLYILKPEARTWEAAEIAERREVYRGYY